jgi:FkbM family methyltransferase
VGGRLVLPHAEAGPDAQGGFSRLQRFVHKAWSQKLAPMYYRLLQTVPGIALPVHLPFGGWWLARNDFCGAALLGEGFENSERRFVEVLLRPGMTVLDIGAHHGFYTLLASRKVGPLGHVLAFEPSPRERRNLRQHLRLNRCRNVRVESCALGETDAVAELFLVHGGETGCNSLRKPNVMTSTTVVRVRVTRLDKILEQQGISRVDFMKLDVEGGELGVFKGSTGLLHRAVRPVMLIEVYDIRTEPWGYKAREIITFLHGLGFDWFQPLEDGGLEPIDVHRESYDGNFVAMPEERAAEFSYLMEK